MPVSVQFSPVYAIETADINKDGRPALLMGGNLFKVQPEIGIYDASYGSCLINTGNGAFTDQSVELGFGLDGEIRDIQLIDGLVHIFRNNDQSKTYRINYE